MKLNNDREYKIYWEGFEDGQVNTLKHNIILMKGQMPNKSSYKKGKEAIKKLRRNMT